MTLENTTRRSRLPQATALTNAVLLSIGCVGSETGNAQIHIPDLRPIAIEMALSEDPEPIELPVAAGLDGEELVAERATAWVSSIEFHLPKGTRCSASPIGGDSVASFAHEWCKAGNRLVLAGSWEVDLVTGRFTPPLEGLSFPEVEIDFVQVTMSRAGFSSSLSIGGSYELDGEVRGFELDLEGAIPAKFDIEASIAVTDDVEGFVLQLGFERWFEGLPLRACLESVPRGNSAGRLQLHAASNQACSQVVSSVRQSLVTRGSLKVKR